MAIQATTIDADLEAVTAALAGVHPRPGRVLLFGSRARGDARPDSDFDLLVVMPQATLTPQERQQALRSLRAVPAAPEFVGGRGSGGGRGGGCPSPVGLPLACGGAGPARGEGA